MMKKPKWLEKDKLYSILFESDEPMGRVFDLVLIVAISLSIIISFVETIPELARTFKLTLEVLEYLLTFFFTLEYIARVYCSPRPKDYVLSFFGIIDLLAIMPPYLSYFFPYSLHRSGHIRLLGYRHNDHSRLRRHHAGDPYRPAAIGIRDAARLYHHRCSYGYRHSQHD